MIMPILSRPVSLLFDLLLVIGFHLLFYIFLNIVFEDIGTYPDSNNVNTLLEILYPVFFSFFTIDAPDTNGYFFTAFSYLSSYFIIRLI